MFRYAQLGARLLNEFAIAMRCFRNDLPWHDVPAARFERFRINAHLRDAESLIGSPREVLEFWKLSIALSVIHPGAGDFFETLPAHDRREVCGLDGTCPSKACEGPLRKKNRR